MLTIFTYHSLDASGSVVSVTPAAFAAQMACLARLGWRGISLREAIGQQQQTGQWPERCAVLTFDDGFANFFDVAGPILNRFGFSATVFLITGHVGGFNDWDAPPPGLGAVPNAKSSVKMPIGVCRLPSWLCGTMPLEPTCAGMPAASAVITKA